MPDAVSRRAFLTAAAWAAATSRHAVAAGEPKVEYRELGRTGLKVSSLGFGCMLVSDPSVIERALELGINYFDTARVYQGGNNERMVGAALKGRRDKVVLATKALASTKQQALEQLDTSLRELGVDYVDIWFLHSRNTPEELTSDLLEALETARKAGKIRFRGVSFHFNMDRMLDHVVQLGVVDVALASYNFTHGPEIGQAIERARKAGLGIVAMKVMAGGFARIRRGDRLYGQDPDRLTARLKQPGAMLAALKWVLRNRYVDTAIVGITDFEELEEDMRAMSEPLTEDEARLLAGLRPSLLPFYCQGCGACGGVCPFGVRVADVQRSLMYAEGYGEFALARQAYFELPEQARAGRCGECSRCQVNCRRGVELRDRLLRAHALLG